MFKKFFAWFRKDEALPPPKVSEEPPSKDQSICCVRCGREIRAGQGVASYCLLDDPVKEGTFKTPSGAYLGCIRMDCCPSGGFFSGQWLGHDLGGYRPLFVEGGTAAQEVFRTGKVVAVNLE